VTFSAQAQNAYQVTAKGRNWQFGQIVPAGLFIQGKAPDGMDIDRYYNFDWVDPKDARTTKRSYCSGTSMRKELEGLVAAPSTIDGGAGLLTGRAAAVFFHEVSVIAAEAPPKGRNRGTNVFEKVGEAILRISSITDDTTMKSSEAGPLGSTSFVMRGVRRRAVALVDHGVREFRDVGSPLVGFPPYRTAHGSGSSVQDRFSPQSNLIVQSSKRIGAQVSGHSS